MIELANKDHSSEIATYLFLLNSSDIRSSARRTKGSEKSSLHLTIQLTLDRPWPGSAETAASSAETTRRWWRCPSARGAGARGRSRIALKPCQPAAQ